MTQTDDTTPLSFVTYINATETGNLPQQRPVLLGTYLKPTGNHALLRDPNGQVRMVQAGDYVGQAVISAVNDGQLEMSLLDQTYALTIPGRA